MGNQALEPEFQCRIGKVREELASRDLEALVVFSQKRSHVRYLTGYNPNYHTNAALLLLPLKSEPILWIKFGFDLPRAKSLTWIQDVRIPPHESNAGLVQACAKEIHTRGLAERKIGIAASDLAVDELSVSLFECMQAQLPSVQFEFASDMLNSIRAIKSPVEVAKMRESARVADTVVEGLRGAIKPGHSDWHAVLAAESAARREGAHCDIILSTDFSKLAFPANHSTFHERSVVTCEITTELDGYWVQLCRTLCIGKPTEAQKEIFAVSQRAYRAGTTTCKKDVSVADVWSAIQTSIAADGYGDCVQYGAGHGVGLDLPEMYPVEDECKSLLPENMVLVIHPAVWAAGRGAAWTGGPILVGNASSVDLDQPQAEILEI